MAESGSFNPQVKRRKSIDLPPTVSAPRLVLVGKTGEGKSSSGNTILGRDAFRAAGGQCAVTRHCCKQQEKVFNREVTVVDTPGLFDMALSDDYLRREISKCINMSAPGPHAILLVIKLGTFTAEEQDAVRQVGQIFGPEAWDYTIILFTHGDKVDSDFDKLLKEAGPELQDLLEKVGHRYCVFNNLRANNRGQVLDLFQEVDKIVDTNRGQFYSNYTYVEVTQMLDQREVELRELYEKKLGEELKAVQSKYERKLSEAREEQQVVRERLQHELEEVRRYYHGLAAGVRYVVENSLLTDSIHDIVKFHEMLKLN